MKTQEMNNGQIFEAFASLKEAKAEVMSYIDAIDILVDETMFIEYKNGSHFYAGEDGTSGAFKQTGIKAVIIENGTTTKVWGAVEIIEDRYDGGVSYIAEVA